MIWRRSQKVVCIGGGPWTVKSSLWDGGEIPQPVKGVVYEIWDIISSYPELPDFVGLVLVEIPGFGCDAKSFRPAVDRPTDISIFTKALLPATSSLEPVP